MDDAKLKKILKNIEVPAHDVNAKKVSINLAMSEFQANQKEKQKKFQGFSLVARLIGKNDKQTRRDSMESKSKKRLVYGGMATAMAVVLVAGGTLRQMENTVATSMVRGGAGVSTAELDPVMVEALEFEDRDDAVAAQNNFIADAPIKLGEQNRLEKSQDGRIQVLKSEIRQKSDHKLKNKRVPGEKKRQRPMAMEEQIAIGGIINAPVASSPAPQRAGSVAPQKEMDRLSRVVGKSMVASDSMRDKIFVEPEVIISAYQEEGRDQFEDFKINPIKLVSAVPVSTFSVDVDTASYSFMRRQLNNGVLPQKDAVRIEEMINYFDYNYAVPQDKSAPFKPTVTITDSPWVEGNKLMHVGIKGYELTGEQQKSNLVFLLDVSGSMNSPDKLPLVKNSMKMLLDSLNPDDTVSIVVYAGAAGAVLQPTKVSERSKIYAAFDKLSAGGSTAGAAGIKLAYQLAEQNFDKDAVNRVILATDGDFNVGITNREELKDFVERKRETGIFLSVLGFGQGNYNDHMMQTLAQNGNGVAAYIDSLNEARKVLVDEATSSLFTIAKDVKIQVEFNPDIVSEYRLIGYETRALKREDFNNDKIDAGDIGAGHTVTAVYEITPKSSSGSSVDPLRYDKESNIEKHQAAIDFSGEYAFLKLRYKLPNEDKSKLITLPVTSDIHEFGEESDAAYPIVKDVQFATAVAGFGQLLQGGQYTGTFSYDDVIELAQKGKGADTFGYRAEFINLVRMAKSASAM